MSKNTDILLLIRGLVKLYDQCMESIRQAHGLSQIEITIVSFLHNNPGVDTAGDIALIRMLPKGNVSQGVDALIRKGLLSRLTDREDRRRIHLKLTEAADDVIARIDEAKAAYQDMIFAGFSSEEVEAMARFNGRLMKNVMDSLRRGGIPQTPEMPGKEQTYEQ